MSRSPASSPSSGSNRRRRGLSKASSVDWALASHWSDNTCVQDTQACNLPPPPPPSTRPRQDGGAKDAAATAAAAAAGSSNPAEGSLSEAAGKTKIGAPHATSPESNTQGLENAGRRKQLLRKTLSDSLTRGKRGQVSSAAQLSVREAEAEAAAMAAPSSGQRPPQPPTNRPAHFSTSCPNLVHSNGVLAQGSKAGSRSACSPNSQGGAEQDSYSSSGRAVGSSSSAGTQRAAPQRLTVPNIFVTSFTHSSDTATAKGSRQTPSDRSLKSALPLGGGRSGAYRHSAPELCQTSRQTSSQWEKVRDYIKPRLRKSNSESQSQSLALGERTSDDGQRSGNIGASGDRANKLDTPLATTTVRNEPRIAKVLAYLYIGNIETSYDDRLTCRLGIRSVIDLSNVHPDLIASQKRSRAPCVCSREERHRKATLRINLDDADAAEMESGFEQINKFIDGARRADRKVLVVCWTGNSLSALAVMQYLMTRHGCSIRRAYSMVMRQGTDIDLSPCHQVVLQTLERRLQSQASLTVEAGRELQPDRLPREAWTTDCKQLDNNTAC